MFRKAQQIPESLYPVTQRINPAPDRSQARRMRCQEHVLSRSGYILHPESRMLLQLRVTADQNRNRCLLHHCRVWMKFGNRIECSPVPNHNKLPGLLVSCRRCEHRRPKHNFQQFIRYRLACIFSDTAPGVNRGKCVHGFSSRPRLRA